MTGSSSEGKETGARAGGGSRWSADDIRRGFSELPFDHQFSTLIRIELDMLANAVEAVVSATSQAIDEIANACSKGSAPAASSASGQAPSA